jgi:hypothetical protein
MNTRTILAAVLLLALAATTASAQTAPTIMDGYARLSDDLTLHYEQAGQGR